MSVSNFIAIQLSIYLLSKSWDLSIWTKVVQYIGAMLLQWVKSLSLKLCEIPEDDMLLCNSVMSISVSHMNQLICWSSLNLLESDRGFVILVWLSCVQACSHFSSPGVWERSQITFLLTSASPSSSFSPFFTWFSCSQVRWGRQRNLTFDTERRQRMNSIKIQKDFTVGDDQNALQSRNQSRISKWKLLPRVYLWQTKRNKEIHREEEGNIKSKAIECKHKYEYKGQSKLLYKRQLFKAT